MSKYYVNHIQRVKLIQKVKEPETGDRKLVRKSKSLIFAYKTLITGPISINFGLKNAELLDKVKIYINII